MRFRDEARRAQLIRGGRLTREQRTGSDRNDDVVGERPSELLGAFEQDRVAALGVIRAQREVHEAPAVLIGEAAAETIHRVIRTLHSNDRGAICRGARDLSGLDVRGHEHKCAKTVARCGSRDGPGEIAGGRAGDRVEPELDRARERDGHGPVFE